METDKRTERAVARLRQYESELRAELAACGDVASALLAVAAGEAIDTPSRLMRAQAINTTLAAIPEIVARFEHERVEIVRSRNEVENATKRKAAREAYKTALREFDQNYTKLSRSQDKGALLGAAKEVARLASAAMMKDDMRKHFREWKSRPRGGDLARF